MRITKWRVNLLFKKFNFNENSDLTTLVISFTISVVLVWQFIDSAAAFYYYPLFTVIWTAIIKFVLDLIFIK